MAAAVVRPVRVPRVALVLASAAALVVTTLVGALNARSASGFSDVPVGSQFHAEMTWVDAAGIATGWTEPDGSRTYRPQEPVSRDAMAAFLHRLAGSPAPATTTSPFTDVSATSEHHAAIWWAYERGIATGWREADGTRTFRPTNPIARDAMAAFLYRYAGEPGAPVSAPFWDVGPEDAFHRDIAWLAAQGITTGWEGPFGCPAYRPLAPIARDAMAAFLYRFEHGGVPVGANTCDDARRGVDWGTLPTDWDVVALTFDGGASDTGVRSILDTLRARGVPATFFVTGEFARTYPDSVRAIVAAGHPVGNHSDTHPYFTGLSREQMREELQRAEAAITPLTGRAAKPLFRFPYGDRSATTIATVNDAGYVPFRWTVDSLGWQGTSGGQTAAGVCSRVLGSLQPGQVVLLHVGAHPTDGSTLDAAALTCIIDGVRSRGYGFFTLDAFAR